MDDISETTPINEEAAARFLGHGFKISFPYNQDRAMWTNVRPYRHLIEEVYAGLHADVFPGARLLSKGQTADEYLEELSALSRELSGDGVALNLVLNTFPPEGRIDKDLLFRHLDQLVSIGNIRISMTDMHWALRLRERYENIPFHVSVTASITNAYKANLWRQMIGADVVTISRDLNKKTDLVRSIRKEGFRIKTVVADFCMPDCPLALHHGQIYNETEPEEAHRQMCENSIICRFTKSKLPLWHMLKKEVLPFQLPQFEGVFDIIKLTDRMDPTEKLINTLIRYVQMEDDVHPVFQYRELPDSLKKLSTCQWTCDTCGWCERHTELVGPIEGKVLDPEEESKLSELIGTAASHIEEREGPVISDRSIEDDETIPFRLKTLPEEKAESKIAREAHSNDDKMKALIASLQLVRDISEAEKDAQCLSMLPLLVKEFRPYIREGKALGNGFYLTRITRPLAGIVGLQWKRNEDKFEIGAVPLDAKTTLPIRGRRMGLMLIDEFGKGQEAKWFRESEHFIREIVE